MHQVVLVDFAFFFFLFFSHFTVSRGQHFLMLCAAPGIQNPEKRIINLFQLYIVVLQFCVLNQFVMIFKQCLLNPCNDVDALAFLWY